MIRKLATTALLVLLAAAPSTASAQDGNDDDGGELLPVGLGELTQDDLAVRLRADGLEIRFVPLDERLIRLLAPDAYRSLRALREGRRARIDSLGRSNGVSEPGLVLVTFYAQKPGTRFQPEILTIGVRNRQLYPLGTIPLSPSFSSQQLELRQQAAGIFLFEDQLPIAEPFTISYGTSTSDEWERKLPMLERERARIGSRVGRDTSRQSR